MTTETAEGTPAEEPVSGPPPVEPPKPPDAEPVAAPNQSVGISLADVLTSDPPSAPVPPGAKQEIATLDAFQLMDRLDEEQVVGELASRTMPILEKLVYRFKGSDGKMQHGLSKRGVDEAVREMAKAGQCFREMKLTVKESAEAIDAKALVARVLVDEDGRERVLETKFGVKRQEKMVWRGWGANKRLMPDTFVYEKACAKALRNAASRLLPEEIRVNLINKVLALLPEYVEDVDRNRKRIEAGKPPSAAPKPAPQPVIEEEFAAGEKIHPKVVQRVQIGFKECGIDEAGRRDFLSKRYGVDSVLDLTNEQAGTLIEHMRILYRKNNPTSR